MDSQLCMARAISDTKFKQMAIKMFLEFWSITRHFITSVDGVFLFDDVHLHSWKWIEHDDYFGWRQMALAWICKQHYTWKSFVQHIDKYGLPCSMQELDLAICWMLGIRAFFQIPHLKNTYHCIVIEGYLINIENAVLFWKTSIISPSLGKANGKKASGCPVANNN